MSTFIYYESWCNWLMKYGVWNISQASPEKLQIEGFSPLVSAVMQARGLDTQIISQSPEMNLLGSPELLTDIEKGVTRVSRAIDSGEQVAVYGDYDVDGITSSCLMFSYLKSRGLEPEIYIPERLEEGYGLSKESLDALHSQGATLIITVDCGIASAVEAEYARKLGIDIVITDHHECQKNLPEAVAVIDPKRAGDQYPYKDLSGVGVAFKFICALEGGDSQQYLLEEYGDLVALGTVADMMPLVGENHFMVKMGLRIMNTRPRPGISALIKDSGLKAGELTAQSISFALAPRLNAAGRMGSAMLAFELLSQDDHNRAEFLAFQLGSLNKIRQNTENRIMTDVMKRLESSGYSGGPIFLVSENWHRGVVGIVAAKLMRTYSAPVALITVEAGVGRGSCRSVPGFNIFKALSHCSDWLTDFGGHELAAGFTVSGEHVERLKAELGSYYSKNPPNRDDNYLAIDFSLDNPELISSKNIRSLSTLEPFGAGNPCPVLCIEGAALGKITPLSGGKHLKFVINKWNADFECVSFSTTGEQLGFVEGDILDIAFTPQINTFYGKSNVQLLVSDVRPPAKVTSTGEIPVENPIKNAAISPSCPDRDDFACLYRYLKSGNVISGNRIRVLSELETGIGKGSAAKYYNVLKIMDELGLLTLTEEGEHIAACLYPNPKKVDLDSSEILRSLRRG